MQAAQTAGIDLPLKILVWPDATASLTSPTTTHPGLWRGMALPTILYNRHVGNSGHTRAARREFLTGAFKSTTNAQVS
jgi:hypothetical protein